MKKKSTPLCMAGLYYELMKLARLKNTDDREAAAIEFLTNKDRWLTLGDEQDDDTGMFQVPVCNGSGSYYEMAQFKTSAQATRFVDLLLLIAKIRDRSDMVESCSNSDCHQ